MKEAPRLNLAHLPTPLQLLPSISEQAGRNIWVKRDDLTGFSISGNKVRKLEYSLAKAKQEGADVVITCGGIQSNHCRATAILGAKLGFKVHLLLRGDEPEQPDGNLFLDQLAGAEISYFAKRYYQAHLDFIAEETCEKYRREGRKPYFIPTGASDAVGVWGYANAAAELKEDFARLEIQPEHILCATGSGGTQAGLTAGVVMHRMPAQVTGYAVCDDEAWFVNKVNTDIHDWIEEYELDLDLGSLDIRVRDAYIGEGYAIAGKAVFDTITQVFRSEALLLDPVYSGKAFYGMLTDISEGKIEGEGDIVFVHTGGAFGLFAQRQQWQKSMG
ncbi:MAG: D-cysteine desulfhydrase family protein [Porticoccaceae bacterium]|jgi:D-cysteine desulfhydrase|nr:D-cysteine desulfhydrase family protein [Porticoccaceae bacterium]